MTAERETLRRAPVVRIYDVRDTTVIVAPDGKLHELSGASAMLTRAVLAFTINPRSVAEIVTHVEALTGAPVSDTAVIDELLALLESTRVLIRERSTTPQAKPGDRRARLVLGLTGAIATALAPGLISLLGQRGFEIRVIATEAALRFVQAQAIEALVHSPVLSSLWPEQSGLPVPHINLAQWADAVLLCPASATTIARLAAGDHSTLVSGVALATRAPVVIVPSMNVEMFGEPATQRNLRQLIADGFHVVHPGSGGEVAQRPDQRSATLGPMPPPSAVVDVLEAALRIDRARHAASHPTPRDAEEWDRLFRTRAAEELAWHVEALDHDLAQALDEQLRPGMRVLDVGTGLGVVALDAARRGAQVVATDVSTTALTRARERAGAAPIVWLRDDITDSRLHGDFELVIDRGCLHVLTAEQARAYADAVTRLTAVGGVLLLVTHDVCEATSRGTQPYDAAAIERLLGAAFELASDRPTSFAGPGVAPRARLFTLRRRA